MGKRELAIERGIPCPGPKGPRTDVGRLARQMKPNESLFFESKASYETARSIIYDLGGRVMTRKRFEVDQETGVGRWGWRVWRMA